MAHTRSRLQNFHHHTPQLADSAWVHPGATVIGKVRIDKDSSIWCGTVVRGDVHSIQIGERSNIQDNSVLHVSHPSLADPDGSSLLIGNDVTVGHGCILHGCQIGHASIIGMGCLVMDKAFIEPEVLLGAGSLVPEGKTLASGNLYLGRPAKLVRQLTGDEIAYLYYSAQNYVRLAAQYRRDEADEMLV